MPEEKPEDLFDEDEEFDPLDVDDEVIDQEWMDDDNPYDTVDYPTMRNMPESMPGSGTRTMFTPAAQGSVAEAVRKLVDYNPARRMVLLEIIDMCRDGELASVVTEKVDELQKHNRSVFPAMTLCHMLERAGALEMEMTEVAEEHEDLEDGTTYLVIDEEVDPTWRSTEEGLAVYEELTQGREAREVILDRDSKYAEVYLAVMQAMDAAPCSREEIDNLTDTFDVVYHPRRYGTHFLDMLEKTDCCIWRDRAWHLTDLGHDLLPEVLAFCEQHMDGEQKQDEQKQEA